MPSLWKSPSGRAKPGRKSIRGTISAPIPIPSVLDDDDDDEFPIRNPGSAKAVDEEFPIRQPGTGIASPVPPVGPEPEDVAPEQQGTGTSAQQHDALPPSSGDAQGVGHQEPEPGPELESGPEQLPPTIEPPVEGAVEGSRTDMTQDIQPEPPSHPPPDPPSGPVAPNDRPTSRSPHKTSPKRGSPQRVSPFTRARTSPATNPPLSIARYSVISDSPSGQTRQSKDTPQRKKSTLRSALGRLFGRSRRKNGGGSQDTTAGTSRESNLMGSSQHRSDPTALVRTTDKSPKRSTSLPLTEYDRPLRSHSVGPHDIMAIESARNSLQADGSGIGTAQGGRRRAATTTSRLLFQSRARNPELGGGLSPRPASTHGRSSQLAAAGEFEDPSEIGRAITSDSANDSANGTRRRSRSLSGLQDLVAHPAGRRRSDEIRFWRESYDPGFMSPLSSNAQEDVDIDDTGALDASVPASPAVERPPKTPPQPFNFGLIPSTMVGMKITQAVTQAESIETRIGGLETRADKLEKVVSQLCRAVPGFQAPLGESGPLQGESSSSIKEPATSAFTTAPPVRVPPIPNTAPGGSRYASSHRSLETMDSHSQISFGDAPTFIGSLHPPSSSATQHHGLTATSGPPIGTLYRPTSNSTVRGAASLPTLGRETTSNDEAYASLAAQLEAERAARQALEAQVKKLSERLNTLSTTMFAMIKAPSESRSHERLTPSGGGNSPLLQPPKAIPVPPAAYALKSLASFEAELETSQATAVEEITRTETEAGTDEVFLTPREEQPPLSYGAFGEELRADDDDENDEGDAGDPKRRKAARTLSLSQLTLGKNQRTQI